MFLAIIILLIRLDMLRGAANSYGASARLCLRRMGTDKSDKIIWLDTHHTSGKTASADIKMTELKHSFSTFFRNL